MAEIWAIILAAGESKRMKTPKMLLPFKGKTIIENVIETVISSDVDKTVVVLGAGHDEILSAISDMPVMHCYNDNYRDGMLSSVICGFRSLPGSFEGAVVFQGDQPMIPGYVISTLINSWRKSGKGIVIPVFEKARGHPIFIARKYINEIEKLNPSEGLRELAVKFKDDVLEVEVKIPEILRDIDTQEDYMKEINQT